MSAFEYEMGSPTLPIKTHFLCGSHVFRSLCCDILGYSIAPHVGLHITCRDPEGKVDDVSLVLARAI